MKIAYRRRTGKVSHFVTRDEVGRVVAGGVMKRERQSGL